MKGFEGLNLGQRPVLLVPRISLVEKVKGACTFTLAEIEGPGIIQHMWMTCFPGHWRNLILRVYWFL